MSTPERDPHTGRKTTGHDWNGIKELNTPIPKIVWAFYISTTLVAILMWVLYPAWPTGRDFTPGVLGVDQTLSLEESMAETDELRSRLDAQINSATFDQLQSDPKLAGLVKKHGARLYSDNCAACHGTAGAGGYGYPSLIDDQWIWGGAPDAIMETLRVGVNTNHPDARISQMMAFGDMGLLDYRQRSDVIAYTLSLQTEPSRPNTYDKEQLQRGSDIFQAQCAICHGTNAKGLQKTGAPNLTDAFWLYGGTPQDLEQTIKHGRQGVMPYWSERLTEVDRKTLTAYLEQLGETEP